MAANVGQLTTINLKIGRAEARGDKAFFEALLAPNFAMRRANGAIVDRVSFIDAVAPSARRTTQIESVSVFGGDRAVVGCVVTMQTDVGPRRFHNLRLFVRENAKRPWALLAWANEPAG